MFDSPTFLPLQWLVEALEQFEQDCLRDLTASPLHPCEARQAEVRVQAEQRRGKAELASVSRRDVDFIGGHLGEPAGRNAGYVWLYALKELERMGCKS